MKPEEAPRKLSGEPNPNLQPSKVPTDPEARAKWAHAKAEEHGWIPPTKGELHEHE